MKKLALALCLLAVSFTAQAQFEKGTTIINPSLSGLDFSYSKNDKAKFGVGAQVGTFFAEGIALMVNAGADWSKPIDEYTLGTGVRFYFNKTGIYLGGGLDWNRFRWRSRKTVRITILQQLNSNCRKMVLYIVSQLFRVQVMVDASCLMMSR